MKWFVFGSRIFVIIIFLHGGMAWGWIEKNIGLMLYIPYIDKKQTIMGIPISCYDIDTGKLLNCGYELNLFEKEPFSGGHNHNGNRPIGLLRERGGSGSGDIFLSGSTEGRAVFIEYLIPEVSGKMEIDSLIIPPGRYVCVYPRDCLLKRNIDVRVLGLMQLMGPSADDHYEKLRGGTDTHPEGHYGTSDTTGKLKMIAKEYYRRSDSDRILSINDISLTWGGLFDWKGTWSPPHNTHRRGTDTDINRKGIDCYYDTDLREAVEEVAGGQTRPYLQCEDDRGRPVPPDDPSGKYKHIDFD